MCLCVSFTCYKHTIHPPGKYVKHYFELFLSFSKRRFFDGTNDRNEGTKKRRLFSLRYIEGTRTNRMILNAKKGTAAYIDRTPTNDRKRKEYHVSLASVETSTDDNERRQDTKRKQSTTDIHSYGKAEKRTTGKARTKERHQRRQTNDTKQRQERRQERQTR